MQSQVGHNPPLNATGILQSQRCSNLISKRIGERQINAVFCSNRLRAIQTARILMVGRPNPAAYKESSALAEGCYIDSLTEFIEQILKAASSEKWRVVLIVSHSSVIEYAVKWLTHKGVLKVPTTIELSGPQNATLSEISLNVAGEAKLTLYDAEP